MSKDVWWKCLPVCRLWLCKEKKMINWLYYWIKVCWKKKKVLMQIMKLEVIESLVTLLALASRVDIPSFWWCLTWTGYITSKKRLGMLEIRRSFSGNSRFNRSASAFMRKTYTVKHLYLERVDNRLLKLVLCYFNKHIF